MDLPRLLVIDDTPAVGATVRLMLDGLCEVALAASLSEAVERLEGARFDAVLCDLNLPDASAERLAARLGQADPGLLSHLVLMGGAIESDVPAAFAQVPSRRRLQKPFVLEDLLAALADAGVVPLIG